MPELDLSQLTIDKKKREPAPAKRRRAVYSRYVVPGVILFGFVALLGWAAHEQFLPVNPVTVVPVVVTRAEVHQAGTPLFQAPGWVEPRPTAVTVPALAEGVIGELLVVAGQDVQAGDSVAKLIDADARLAVQQAEAALKLQQAERTSAKAEVVAAQQRLEKPVHLDASIAEADSLLAAKQTEAARLPFLIKTAEAELEFSKQNLTGKQAVADVLAARLIQKAQSEFDSASAALDELRVRGPRLEREIETLQQRRDALAKQRELLVEEIRGAADAAAKLEAAESRVIQAELTVQSAKLQLERMTVRSPIKGRVLALIAGPGVRVMGMSQNGAPDASSVVSLYDPEMLQVRVDVRLEDTPLVEPGQPVRMEIASEKKPVEGVVLSATSQANVQKNTLEVKVGITSPPSTIRPEMLASATFLASEKPGTDSEESKEQERLLIPKQLVEGEGENRTVWVADADGVAQKRTVRLGNAGTEVLVEVIEGLAPTDKLISGGREGLNDGDRIRIQGEDKTIGTEAANI